MCTRNRLSYLIRFTESLYKQVILPEEFIIVDSSDERIDSLDEYKLSIVNKKPAKTNLFFYHTKAGLTYQRNFGVNKSSNQILFFFDDDIVLESNFIKYIMDTFNKNTQYFGGMGNMTNYNNPSTKSILKEMIKGFFGIQRAYGNGKFYLSGFPSSPIGSSKFIETEVLAGGLTAYRKEIFNEFKFDESVTGYSYMEDVDFSRRVSYKYKCFYNPKALCDHRHGEGGRGTRFDNRKMLMINFRYFYFKNFYARNKQSIFAHWFSIFGLFLLNWKLEDKQGLYAGLKYFHKLKTAFISRTG